MLEVGDKAPDFSLLSDEGKTIKLSDLKGTSVVLYFYPKDDTTGCTAEACSFRDHYREFEKKKVTLLGVSMDGVQSHQKFKNKYGLPFPLLMDENAVLSKKYGVYQQKSMYGRKYWGLVRSTFVIGPDGKFKMIFPKVKVNGHTAEVLKALE